MVMTQDNTLYINKCCNTR